MSEHDDKYTDPELRERIKDELMRSEKGGKSGQWSARKSQLLVLEYERQGGGYRGKKDDAARSLEAWTEQDWQTVDGDERARTGSATKRYLPKAVWDKLSDADKREAEQTKVKGSRKGEQHIDWPPAVKRAMDEYEREQRPTHGSDQGATKEELYEQAQKLNIKGRSSMNKAELERAIKQTNKL